MICEKSRTWIICDFKVILPKSEGQLHQGSNWPVTNPDTAIYDQDVTINPQQFGLKIINTWSRLKTRWKFPHRAHRNTYDLNRSLLKQKAHKKYHHHHHHHHHDHRYSRRLTRSLGWPVNPSSQSHLLSLSNLINSNFLLVIIIIVQHLHNHHCFNIRLSSLLSNIIIIIMHQIIIIVQHHQNHIWSPW